MARRTTTAPIPCYSKGVPSHFLPRTRPSSFNRNQPPLFDREPEEGICRNHFTSGSVQHIRLFTAISFFTVIAILNRTVVFNFLSALNPINPLTPSINGISPTSATHSQNHAHPVRAFDSNFLSNTMKRDRRQNRATSFPLSSTSSPREANLAFFLQIAENTVPLLPRLLKALYHPNNVYVIHFDLKITADVIVKAMSDIRSNETYAKNVHIMDSDLITYRGISMLLNTINAIHLLTELSVPWDYFINLSGADYPLQSPRSLRIILGHKLGLNFFTFAAKRTWASMAENRVSELWFDEALAFHEKATVNKLTKLRVRNPLVDTLEFTVSHAEAWMITSRAFCEFSIRSDMARKMLAAFSYAVDSSEHFFASLAWNHQQFKSSIVPHSLRLIIWKNNGVLSGQHPYKMDELNMDGSFKFEESVNSTVLLFARKFERPNSSLMDLIDARAERKDVIAQATDHVHRKIERKKDRLAEL